MDVVGVISFISSFITGVCAGIGTAAYFWLRRWAPKMSERMEWVEFDIDLMYQLHKMEPPSLMRIKLREEMDSRETKHD